MSNIQNSKILLEKYKIIFFIIDIDNNINSYNFNRKVWKKIFNKHKEILGLFIKFKQINSEYEYDNDNKILFIKNDEDNIDRKIILKKTIKVLKFCYENFNFDWIIRIKLSSFWRINKLLCFLNERQLDKYILAHKSKKIERKQYISDTGIIIPRNFVSLIFNYDEYNIDNVEISEFYLSKGIRIQDVKRFNNNFFLSFDEENKDNKKNKENIDSIKDKLIHLNNNEIYYRVKSNIYDKYILNELFKINYNESLLSDKKELLLKKIIKIKESKLIKLLIPKKTFFYCSVFINKLFKNVIITHNLNDTDYDILITHVCERQEHYNSDKLNIIISGEIKNSRKTYDISISTIYNFNSIKNLYYPFGYLSLNEHQESINNKDYYNTRQKFCAYMYSCDHEHRIKYFKLLSNYKKVDGLDKSCKNVEINDTRTLSNFNDIAVGIYTEYKFVLALENSFKEGYFTEKMLNPLIANSIPIYWGHSDVFKYINKKRVIYIQDFETDEKLLEYIKYIDNNDIEYNKIVNENIYVEEMEPINFEKKFIENFIQNFLS
jgi:hypothetical protein